MDPRQQTLNRWLETLNLPDFSLTPLPSDASFRRYFRLTLPQTSYIVMDNPDIPSCQPFIAISRALRSHGLNAPDILQENKLEGFLLLTDLGDLQLLHALNPSNMERLYQNALTTLAHLQTCDTSQYWSLPIFTTEWMSQELELFREWFLEKYLNLPLSPLTLKSLSNHFIRLSKEIAQQPTAFMHRDYHSANLMILSNEEIGLLDFQDAFIGPITYDLVSLLKDCYIDWPEERIQPLALTFRDTIGLKVSDELFLRWFDVMGLQRHLKALLTFSRKYKRDHNTNYLKHIPRTLNYAKIISARYKEYHMIHEILAEVDTVCAPLF